MTVEDGHVVDVDGGGGAPNGSNNNAAAAGAKYAQSSADHATVTSGVGRNSLFAPDDENANQVLYRVKLNIPKKVLRVTHT